MNEHKEKLSVTIPTIGRIVWYRTDGRNGLVYDLPAIITCTADTHPGDYPDGRKNPIPVPDKGRAHLVVFTPGGFGTEVHKASGLLPQPADADYKDSRLVPGSGTYVEWNVPFVPDGLNPAPRTWRWPDRGHYRLDGNVAA
jgi:hypothetical protein